MSSRKRETRTEREKRERRERREHRKRSAAAKLGAAVRAARRGDHGSLAALERLDPERARRIRAERREAAKAKTAAAEKKQEKKEKTKHLSTLSKKKRAKPQTKKRQPEKTPTRAQTTEPRARKQTRAEVLEQIRTAPLPPPPPPIDDTFLPAAVIARARAGDPRALLQVMNVSPELATEIAIGLDRERRERLRATYGGRRQLEAEVRAERLARATAAAIPEWHPPRSRQHMLMLARGRRAFSRFGVRDVETETHRSEAGASFYTIVGRIMDGSRIHRVRLYEIEDEQGEQTLFWTYADRIDAWTPREAHAHYPLAGDASFTSAWSDA